MNLERAMHLFEAPGPTDPGVVDFICSEIARRGIRPQFVQHKRLPWDMAAFSTAIGCTLSYATIPDGHAIITRPQNCLWIGCELLGEKSDFYINLRGITALDFCMNGVSPSTFIKTTFRDVNLEILGSPFFINCTFIDCKIVATGAVFINCDFTDCSIGVAIPCRSVFVACPFYDVSFDVSHAIPSIAGANTGVLASVMLGSELAGGLLTPRHFCLSRHMYTNCTMTWPETDVSGEPVPGNLIHSAFIGQNFSLAPRESDFLGELADFLNVNRGDRPLIQVSDFACSKMFLSRVSYLPGLLSKHFRTLATEQQSLHIFMKLALEKANFSR